MCFYVWGEAGSGKSHLLKATIIKAAQEQRPTTYFVADSSLDGPPAMDSLIVVDDVDRLDAENQAHLFRLLISAREARAALLLAGSVPPQTLPLREDVRTRIGQGMIYAIQPLNDADKATLLRRQAILRGITLDEDIVEYLLRHGRRDIAWLMAVLDALDEVSLTEGRRVTLPLLRELLRDTCEPELPFF